MAGFNMVTLVGNLTRDPESRYTSSGTAVTELNMAVNTKRAKSEETIFIGVVVWAKLAEACIEYLGKGSQVLVFGRLQQDEWVDKDTGKRRIKMKVVADEVQFLGGRRGNTQRSVRPESEGDSFRGDEVPF